MPVQTGQSPADLHAEQARRSPQEVLEILLSDQEATPENLEPFLDYLERNQ